jgi:hypothetical protein
MASCPLLLKKQLKTPNLSPQLGEVREDVFPGPLVDNAPLVEKKEAVKQVEDLGGRLQQ